MAFLDPISSCGFSLQNQWVECSFDSILAIEFPPTGGRGALFFMVDVPDGVAFGEADRISVENWGEAEAMLNCASNLLKHEAVKPEDITMLVFYRGTCCR